MHRLATTIVREMALLRRPAGAPGVPPRLIRLHRPLSRPTWPGAARPHSPYGRAYGFFFNELCIFDIGVIILPPQYFFKAPRYMLTAEVAKVANAPPTFLPPLHFSKAPGYMLTAEVARNFCRLSIFE